MKFQNGQKVEISVDKKGHFRVKVDSQVKIETKKLWPFKWKWLFVSWFNNTPLVWKYHALNVMNQMAVCRDRQHAAPDVCCLPSAEGLFFFWPFLSFDCVEMAAQDLCQSAPTPIGGKCFTPLINSRCHTTNWQSTEWY